MQEAQDDSPRRILRSLVPPHTYLYHYTSAETLGLILRSRSLRLGPYASTNDPAESQLRSFGMGGVVTPEREREDSYWRDNAGIDRLTRQRAMLTCLTMERPHDPEDGYGYFHRGWGRARMWEQYAGGHTGACLVFLQDHLESAIAANLPPDAMYYHDRIAYEDRRLVSSLSWTQVDRLGMDETVKRYLRRNWRERFFTKNTDWSSEVEYRYVVLHDGGPIMIPVRKPLAAIVLGAKFAASGLPALSVDLLASGFADVPLGACRWHDGAPWLSVPPWPSVAPWRLGGGRDERL